MTRAVDGHPLWSKQTSMVMLDVDGFLRQRATACPGLRSPAGAALPRDGGNAPLTENRREKSISTYGVLCPIMRSTQIGGIPSWPTKARGFPIGANRPILRR